MKFGAKTVTLRDGHKVTLKNPDLHEATDIMRMVAVASSETRFLLNSTDVFMSNMTIEKEEKWIE